MPASKEPELIFCPYCGRDALKFVKSVPRCTDCGAVFHVQFSRIARVRKESYAPGQCAEIVCINLGADGTNASNTIDNI